MLYILMSYMATDVITTVIGVYVLGATELSPICELTGFWLFMLIKVVACVACVYTLYRFCIPLNPMASACGLVCLLVLYVAACAHNIYQIAGQIL